MHLTYKITAQDRPRLLARTIQLFDQKLLTMSSLTFVRLNGDLHLEIKVESTLELANRLVAQLYHQLGIHTVELLKNGCAIGYSEAAGETSGPHTEA